jgi:hypothetical protein
MPEFVRSMCVTWDTILVSIVVVVTRRVVPVIVRSGMAHLADAIIVGITTMDKVLGARSKCYGPFGIFTFTRVRDSYVASYPLNIATIATSTILK